MYKSTLNIDISPDKSVMSNDNANANSSCDKKKPEELFHLLPYLIEFIDTQSCYWSQFGFMDTYDASFNLCEKLMKKLKEERRLKDDDADCDSLNDDTYIEYK